MKDGLDRTSKKNREEKTVDHRLCSSIYDMISIENGLSQCLAQAGCNSTLCIPLDPPLCQALYYYYY